MRGDRQHSMVGKHAHPQPDTVPKRQQTIPSFHSSTKSGGHERQEHHSKRPEARDLQVLKERAQTANKTPNNGSHAPKKHSNHVVRDSGAQTPHDARLPNRHHSHHVARSFGSQSSHQRKVAREPTKSAPTDASKARIKITDRLKASIPAHQQQLMHHHPASQRVQTQARAQIAPSLSSSAHKQERSDKAAHLAKLAEEEEEKESWSEFNVAMYEAKMAAPVVARQTHANISLAFPTQKPVTPRQQQPPPPSPPPTVSHPKPPSSAQRKPANVTILQGIRTQRRLVKANQARAQNDIAATDEDELPDVIGKHDTFFGTDVSHEFWKPSAEQLLYRPTYPFDDTATQNAAGSDDAKPQLTHETSSGSNNFSGIHPGSLPSKPNIGYQHDNEDESDPTDEQPLPKGPFALNSAAGVRAIEKRIPPPPPRSMVLPYETTSSSRTTTQRFMGSSSHRAKTAGPHQDSPFPFSKASAAKPRLYITANDLHLYKWRSEKLTWAETRERWSKLHGTDAKVNRSEDSLRTRFRAVQKAIEDERVEQELCSAVLEGVEGAEEELNRVVAEVQQEQAEPELELVTGGVFRKITSGKSGGNIKQEYGRQQQQQISTAQQHQQYASNLPAPNPQLAIAGTRPPSPPRALQGGKFYDATTFQAYIEHMGETLAEAFSDSDADSHIDLNSPREASPVCAADSVQWEYFMKRRDFTADDVAALLEHHQDPTASLAEIETEEETEAEVYNPQTRWKTYPHTFNTLSDANAEATHFLWTTPLGLPQTYSATGNFDLSSKIDEFGMSTFSLKSSLGLSQVRVARQLLTYQDHIIPERSEKEGWVPRTLWCVVVKVRDPKKGPEVEDSPSSISNNKIFSSLALANGRAIDEWVKLTVKIRSANLNQIQIERDQARISLYKRLERVGRGGDDEDDDDGSGERAKLFKEVLVEEPGNGETTGGGRRVEVFVQKVVLEGPRN